jgi:FkbM family methyltransferase
MNYDFPSNCQFNGPDLDKLYKDAFGYINNGWFVEVGASNGQDYSNTCGLADIGWCGVYIEPVKELADQCRIRHNKPTIQVLNVAAGCPKERVDFVRQPLWMIPEWGTGTLNHDAAAKISKDPQLVLVEVRTLNRVLVNEHVPVNFDLLVIDVDFGEIDVLKGFNIGFWRPKLIVIELHDEGQPLSFEIQNFAEPYFARAGYRKVYHDGINTVFQS